MANKKEIVSLDDIEHVLLRPTMYIGSIENSEEKVPIVKDGKLVAESKNISVGFYKLMNEILDNSFDEAKRLNGKMPKIEAHFDSKTKKVSIRDYGEGFYKGTDLNSKTGLNNIETAMSELKAGSNFFDVNEEDALIGTNGVGASLVNMLSSEFTIETINSSTYYKRTWLNFEPQEKIERKRKRGEKLGTMISFIPRDRAQVHNEKISLFEKCTWDKEYIASLMIFKNYLKNNDEQIKNLEFSVTFDGKELDLDQSFLPENHILIQTKLGIFAFWERYENAASLSFINGAQCSGIQQKIFNDWINDMFDYNLAHHFYETLVILNLPPKLVRFADQNKTRYAVGRWEIEDLFKRSFYKKINRHVKNSNIFQSIQERIDERLFKENINTIKKKTKAAKKKISDKYFAPSKVKDTLFIVEGNSARGSILQKRNPEQDGVYTLKGKIKNAKKISDLSSNNEIIDLMSILGIEPKTVTKCQYDKVVIATDWDPDGIGHIASLLINLFYKWFPHIIENHKLKILITPLVSADKVGKRDYFYSIEEFRKQSEKESYKNIRYLKGLGSLSKEDWEWVMKQRRMFAIYKDRSSKKYINIAFGNSSESRKKWLQN